MGPREIRRQEGGEEGRRGGGKEGSRGGGTETETRGPGGGRRPLCLRTMRRGKGARAGPEGRGLAPETSCGTRLADSPFPAAIPGPEFLSPGTTPRSLSVAPENPGVQTLAPSSPTQGSRP